MTAPLTVDCAKITPAGLSYLREQNVTACGIVARGVAPAATGYASGNCGSSSITINNLGGGKAHLKWAFSSKLGPVVERELDINWFNVTRDREGSVLDIFPMFAVSYTSSWYTESTGTGVVSAEMNGQVIVDGVLDCAIGVPFATTTVS